MTKISTKDFLGTVMDHSQQEQAQKQKDRVEYATAMLVEAECSVVGAAVLLELGRLASRFDDFPKRVNLCKPNGRRGEFDVVLEGGKWRIRSAIEGHSITESFSGSASISDFANEILSAMKAPISENSLKSYREATAWSADSLKFAVEIAEAVAFMPRHAREALLVHGPSLGYQPYYKALGSRFPDVWVSSLVQAGVDIDARPSERVAPALKTAAAKGNLVYMSSLLANGAEADGPDGAGDPIFAAVSGGHFECYEMLRGCGANTDVVNGLDETLLHAAAEAAASSVESSIKLGIDLIGVGVPIGARNCHRRTAEDLLFQVREEAQGEQSEEAIAKLDKAIAIFGGDAPGLWVR